MSIVLVYATRCDVNTFVYGFPNWELRLMQTLKSTCGSGPLQCMAVMSLNLLYQFFFKYDNIVSVYSPKNHIWPMNQTCPGLQFWSFQFFRAQDMSQAPCPCLLTPAFVFQIPVMVMVLIVAVVSVIFTISHLTSFCLYLLSLMRYTHHYLLLFTLTCIQPRVRI